MLEPLEQLQKTLQQSAFSITTPRRIIFEALQGHEPLTMHELYAACADQVDRASVYRTVALFEKLGIVQRLQMGWKYKLELSDAFSHHHHHCTCVGCGRVIPLIEDSKLENRLRSLAQAANFLPQDHQLEIRGLCSNCRP